WNWYARTCSTQLSLAKRNRAIEFAEPNAPPTPPENASQPTTQVRVACEGRDRHRRVRRNHGRRAAARAANARVRWTWVWKDALRPSVPDSRGHARRERRLRQLRGDRAGSAEERGVARIRRARADQPEAPRARIRARRALGDRRDR